MFKSIKAGSKTESFAKVMVREADKSMDEVCSILIAEGVAKDDFEARDWYRYVVRKHGVPGTIVARPKGKAAVKAAPAPIPAPVIIPVAEQEHVVIEVGSKKKRTFTPEQKAARAKAARTRRANAKAAKVALANA